MEFKYAWSWLPWTASAEQQYPPYVLQLANLGMKALEINPALARVECTEPSLGSSSCAGSVSRFGLISIKGEKN